MAKVGTVPGYKGRVYCCTYADATEILAMILLRTTMSVEV